MLAQPAHDAVGIAEGHALAYEVIGKVGGKHVALAGQRFDAIGVQLHARQHVGEDGQGRQQRVYGVEEPFLILLQVPVVGQRQSFENSEDAHQTAVNPARFTPGDLGKIRVPLLRHDAAAGGELVGQAHKVELATGPDDDLLG